MPPKERQRDDDPRDSLGRRKRRKRYDVEMPLRLHRYAKEAFRELAESKNIKPMALHRRIVMREVHVFLAGKKNKEQQQ